MLDVNYKSYVGSNFGQLPNSLIGLCFRKNIRPTVKGLLYEPGHHTRQQVASYEVARLRKQKVKVFTGVGGGVEIPGWVSEFLRETTEELSSCKLPPSCVKQAHILQIGIVPSSRRVSSKFVVIIGVPVSPFHIGNLEPNGNELRNLQIGDIAETAARVKRCTGTAREMTSMYLGALTSLREICS